MSKMLIIRHISMGSEKTLNYTKNRYEWRITTIFFTENLSNRIGIFNVFQSSINRVAFIRYSLLCIFSVEGLDSR